MSIIIPMWIKCKPEMDFFSSANHIGIIFLTTIQNGIMICLYGRSHYTDSIAASKHDSARTGRSCESIWASVLYRAENSHRRNSRPAGIHMGRAGRIFRWCVRYAESRLRPDGKESCLMPRGKMKYPRTPEGLTQQGVTRKEYVAFLDLLAEYQQRNKSLLPAGKSRPLPPSRNPAVFFYPAPCR